MKSPVFGLGRNRKHRAHSSKVNSAAANVNMRGKKEKSMSCYCCVCVDYRDDMIKAIHTKEMREY